MAAAAAGIFNHALSAAQALTGTGATSMASPATETAETTGTSSSGGSSATISANDFLTLLVTEMQNQDPTADTDPNEYINQLVNVNSLEQLIDINQNLSKALGNSGTSSVSTVSAQATRTTPALAGASPAGASTQTAAAVHNSGALAAAQSAASGAGTANNLAALYSTAKRAPGNLSVPDAGGAAHRVAHALDGLPHAQSIAGGWPGVQ